MTETSEAKRHFFISFTGADRRWARWVASTLTEAGYTYWFQDQDFRGSIPRSIGDAIRLSERTILLLSDAYARSGWCRAEWEARFMEDQDGTKDLLIPFRAGSCVVADPLLARLAFRDLFDKDEPAARELVCQRLRQALDRGYRVPLGSVTFPGARPDAPFPIPPHNLPQPNRAFVGRTAELEALRQALGTGRPAAITQPQAVTGLGGIGKTQLALAYAYAHLADYDLVRWLRAEEPATLAADYAALAPALGLDPATPDQAALIAAIRAGLERTPRWLLVFDNAPGPAELRPYLPPTGAGHVLVTSRERLWRGTASAIELDLLPTADAVTLLVGPAPDPALRAEAERLAADLDHLPLALAQARAYLDELAVDIPAYRQRLRESARHVLAHRPEDADYPHSVATAWQASMDAAERRCAAARPLLELLAFLAPDAVPRSLLAAEPGALPEALRDAAERDAAVGALHRFSLLRGSPQSITVHRLVQAVTRDALDGSTAGTRAEAAVRLVHAALPRPPWEHTNWPVIGTLLPHALAAAEAAERLGTGLEAAGTVLNETALYHKARAAWAEAEPLYVRAIAIGENALGPDHPDTATRLNNLAELYRATGRLAEAEPLFRRALAIDETVYGPDHPDVATDLVNLADFYRATGRLAEAEPLFRRTLAILEKALPANHPNVAIVRQHLASLLAERDRDPGAKPASP